MKNLKEYWVRYRDEIEVLVKANSEEEAISIAERYSNWKFSLGEGHKDFFTVEEIT